MFVSHILQSICQIGHEKHFDDLSLVGCNKLRDANVKYKRFTVAHIGFYYSSIYFGAEIAYISSPTIF